ncbi:MAG: phosphodiester glycosidase family protein [Oscillospiraceae bacterium]|nr:phosphodiester glycosidase family protein [Oscillospiraceae bacterium]
MKSSRIFVGMLCLLFLMGALSGCAARERLSAVFNKGAAPVDISHSESGTLGAAISGPDFETETTSGVFTERPTETLPPIEVLSSSETLFSTAASGAFGSSAPVSSSRPVVPSAPAASSRTVTSTTKKPDTTKAVTKIPTKHEIDASNISSPIAGGRVTRAWRVQQGGVSVYSYRLEYGDNYEIRGTNGKTALVKPVITVSVVNASPDRLHFESASMLLGVQKASMSEMARKAGAVVAISGAYFTPHEGLIGNYLPVGPVVREGRVVSSPGGSSSGLCVYKDGSWRVENIGSGSVNGQIARGLWFSLQDMHLPLLNGTLNHQWGDLGDDNYTFFGQVSRDQYVMGVGEFMSRDNMVRVLQAYGAKTLVECNGGNCSEMYLEGVGNAANPARTDLGADKLNMTHSEANKLYGTGNHPGSVCNMIDIIYFK